METMTHESWGLCFCGEYHGVKSSELYDLGRAWSSRADVVLSPDGLEADGYDHYVPSFGMRLRRVSLDGPWMLTSRYDRKVTYEPEPGQEFADADGVDRLPVDSVIADADGFVFQVQESAQFDQHGTVLVHAYLAGIEGMGYASSWGGLNYPATLLRHGGGGAVASKQGDEEEVRERRRLNDPTTNPDWPVGAFIDQYEVDRHAEKQHVSYNDAWRYFESQGYDMSEVDPQS